MNGHQKQGLRFTYMSIWHVDTVGVNKLRLIRQLSKASGADNIP